MYAVLILVGMSTLVLIVASSSILSLVAAYTWSNSSDTSLYHPHHQHFWFARGGLESLFADRSGRHTMMDQLIVSLYSPDCRPTVTVLPIFLRKVSASR